MKKCAIAAFMAASLFLTEEAFARTFNVTSTAYSPCSSGSRMANGRHTHWGAVANNFLPLGTQIRLSRPVLGRRVFTVEDRIGSGSQLDIFMPSCSAAIRYGRHTVSFSTI